MRSPCLLFLLFLLLSSASMNALAQVDPALTAAYDTTKCSSCAEWNRLKAPFRIYGNTYYVGTEGLGSVLVTSDAGHVLIDAGLPDTAPLIMSQIGALGFDISDIRYVLNSHAHHDHAGGLAAMAQASGATVVVSARSAEVLRTGRLTPDDPQHAIGLDVPAVAAVQVIADGASITFGDLTLTAYRTPGHTPGGTTWSWRSCAAEVCHDLVYADSMTPVSADGFLFSRSPDYPGAVADFDHSFAVLEELPCDILLTPHPAASRMWERLADGSGQSGRCAGLHPLCRQRAAPIECASGNGTHSATRRLKPILA